MSDIYYLNTRLRAMRGQLLNRESYQRILTLPDIPALISYLLDSPYGRSIESVGEATSDVARVEEGLRRHLSEILTKLFTISAGECQDAIRLLLGYWEIQTLKTILRGKNVRLSAGEILPSLIPTGLYDEAALDEMCRQPDLRAVVDLLVTWRDPYGRALSQALKGYREPKDLFLLETALDHFYFEQACEKIKKTYRTRPGSKTKDPLSVFLSLLVDRTNLMTALKVVEEKIVLVDSQRYFLPGGQIYSEEDFAGLLSAPNLQEVLKMAAKSFFKPILKAPGGPPGQMPALSVVERQLDKALLQKMRALMRRDPLSTATLVSYLLDKLREITNLRMILRGRLVNLPEPELLQFLILEY